MVGFLEEMHSQEILIPLVWFIPYSNPLLTKIYLLCCLLRQCHLAHIIFSLYASNVILSLAQQLPPIPNRLKQIQECFSKRMQNVRPFQCILKYKFPYFDNLFNQKYCTSEIITA